MWEYMRMFFTLLPIPHNIVMDLNKTLEPPRLLLVLIHDFIISNDFNKTNAWFTLILKSCSLGCIVFPSFIVGRRRGMLICRPA